MLDAVNLPLDITTVKGFLADDEGAALYRYAQQLSELGPCLEVGSYCGKSTVYLGAACKRSGSQLYAIDHHRGSEEHQFGEEYHDSEVYDESIARVDTFRAFRHTLSRAELEDAVVPIVTGSALAARFWCTPLAMVFIDGGHSLDAAMTDYRSWAGHIMKGGVLAIHDLFPNPEEGGQAPITIYRLARDSGLFEEIEVVNTLGLLRRV